MLEILILRSHCHKTETNGRKSLKYLKFIFCGLISYNFFLQIICRIIDWIEIFQENCANAKNPSRILPNQKLFGRASGLVIFIKSKSRLVLEESFFLLTFYSCMGYNGVGGTSICYCPIRSKPGIAVINTRHFTSFRQGRKFTKYLCAFNVLTYEQLWVH